jgi:hypothetical protein
MADLLAPIRRRFQVHGRIFVRHHKSGLAMETLFVKLKGGFALAIERQMWV